MDLHAAEMQPDVIAQALVVIAGDVDEARALAYVAHQLLQHVVVGLGPVGPAAHAPEVDDVADQVDHVGVHVLHEIQQRAGLRRARAEMHVRYEQGPHVRVDVRIGWIGVGRIAHDR